MMYVGIDPGKKTGFAVCNEQDYISVDTLQIHQALDKAKNLVAMHQHICFVLEDAWKISWSGNKGIRAQGAGSVKRDCTIWKDFFKEKDINYMLVKPGSTITKVKSNVFYNATGWKGRTSEHARDAAMLIFCFLRGPNCSKMH